MRKYCFIAVLSLCVLVPACAKVEVDCLYTVRALGAEEKSDKKPDVIGGVRVFAYFADYQEWEVASYEDALEGIIRSVEGSGTRTPDVVGEPYADEGEAGLFDFRFTEKPVMLVAVHTEYPVYGWRNAGVVDNLERMNIPVVFQLWKYLEEDNIIKEDEEITDSAWDRGAGWKMIYISTWTEPEEPENPEEPEEPEPGEPENPEGPGPEE